MLIDKIQLYTTNRYIQINYNNESKIEIKDIKFTIKNKYDNYTWLVEINNKMSDILSKINDKLCDYDNKIKCQNNYLKNNNIIIKIKTLRDKIILDTNINILQDDLQKELVGSIYLDQIWLYKGNYHYKWKLSELRYTE